MKKVIIFQQHPLEWLPPLVSLMRILKHLGCTVVYVGLSDSEYARQILNELSIEYHIYSWRQVRFKEKPLVRLWQKLTNPIRHLIFRKWAWYKINEINELAGADSDVLLWAHSMVSAAILGNRAMEYGKRYIVTLYDLGDEAGRNYVGFDINSLYKSATLVECEYNRANIVMAEKGLEMLPFVLPNKPYLMERQRNLPVTSAVAAQVVKSWKGRKVILYQGALQSDRGRLFCVLEWLCSELPDVVVAVMGHENDAILKLKSRYDNFSFVPFVPPPHHLEVTSNAHIGIAMYRGGSVYGLSPLNPIYCAPNKIFEYAGFGIPMLCNDIPGLRYTVGVANAGICLGELNMKNVIDGVRKILENYNTYSENAIKFYESVDTVAIVNTIVNYAINKEGEGIVVS